MQGSLSGETLWNLQWRERPKSGSHSPIRDHTLSLAFYVSWREGFVTQLSILLYFMNQLTKGDYDWRQGGAN